jgi:glycosyltransferase involved in cell wall biosynthesis
MVHERTGLMVNPNDIDALASAIIRMLHNKKESKKFGKQARQHLIRYFHPNTISEQNIKRYINLLA